MLQSCASGLQIPATKPLCMQDNSSHLHPHHVEGEAAVAAPALTLHVAEYYKRLQVCVVCVEIEMSKECSCESIECSPTKGAGLKFGRG